LPQFNTIILINSSQRRKGQEERRGFSIGKGSCRCPCVGNPLGGGESNYRLNSTYGKKGEIRRNIKDGEKARKENLGPLEGIYASGPLKGLEQNCSKGI